MKRIPLIYFAAVSFILFFTIINNSGCKVIKPTKGKGIIDTQLVVWLKPGKTNIEFNKWLDSVKLVNGNVTIDKKCESCDNSLMLLTGAGINTFIQGNTASGGKASSTTTPATGDDGPVYHSLNFPITYIKPDKVYSESVRPVPFVKYAKGPVKVAVLDTGIDTFGLKHYPFISESSSCISGADVGWNFVGHNKDVIDSNSVRHGSTVTRFITEQAVKYKQNSVQILPVKTHDKNGVSDLFTILCAFAYAKERGVQIINASFGFYVPRLELYKKYPVDPNVRLLREFVKYYLTSNKILLIAAAGNEDDLNEHATFDSHRLQLPDLEYPSDPRNLELVSFYPASLARDPAFPNVIAVTTVDTLSGTVSPIQNFSPYVIDLGVNADSIVSPSHYVFTNPHSLVEPTAEGSSFATPIVAGMLCANYDTFKSVLYNSIYTKAKIFELLSPTFIKSKDTLKAETRDGKYIMR